MLPSRGLAQASRGLGLQRQMLSRSPVRSIPRKTASLPTAASSRQFGTSLQGHGRRSLPTPTIGFRVSTSRIGAAGVFSSHSVLSTRRFASTESSNAAASNPSPELNTTFNPDFSSFADLEGQSLFDITERVGYLAQLGLDYGWGPTSVCQYVLEHLHFTAGLPWWASIVGVGVVIRLAMVHPALVGQQESVKAREMRQDPLYKETQAKYMSMMAQGKRFTPAELMEMRMQTKFLQEKAGVKNWKMVLPMMQVPFAFCMFKLTRAMAALPVPGLENAGVLWFTDLTIPDPFYVLPCVSAVVMVLSMKRALPFMSDQQAKIMSKIPWVLGPLGILVTMNMAASVQIFLAAAAVLQYIQTTLWNISFVRRLCGLPPLEEMVENPNFIKKSSSSSSQSSGGMQYQAPRTISTTAKEHGQAKATTSSVENPISYFRDIMQQSRDKVKEFQSRGVSDETKAAEEREAKRVQEESLKYQSRVNKQRQRKSQRKP